MGMRKRMGMRMRRGGDEDEDGVRVLGLQKWGPPQNGPKVKFH